MRKRFIAAAVCPQCQQKDTLAFNRQINTDIITCVKCGYQMDEAARQQNKTVDETQVIAILHPK